MSLMVNNTKYGEVKANKFTIDQLSNDTKIYQTHIERYFNVNNIQLYILNTLNIYIYIYIYSIFFSSFPIMDTSESTQSDNYVYTKLQILQL